MQCLKFNTGTQEKSKRRGLKSGLSQFAGWTKQGLKHRETKGTLIAKKKICQNELRGQNKNVKDKVRRIKFTWEESKNVKNKFDNGKMTCK